MSTAQIETVNRQERKNKVFVCGWGEVGDWLFIHLPNKNLLNSYYVPATVLSIADTL